MSLVRSLFAGLVSTALLCGSALATPVSGVGVVTGSVTLKGTSLDFGTNLTGSSGTGSFAGLTSGAIQSLTGGTTSLAGLATLSGGVASPITFDLTSVPGGTGTSACSGLISTVCTPSGSELTITQEPGAQIDVTFTLLGQAYTGSKASGYTPYKGVFTSQVAGFDGTTANFLSDLAGGGVSLTYQATFSATGDPVLPSAATPEPSSMLLLATGVASAGWLRIRTMGRRRAAR